MNVFNKREVMCSIHRFVRSVSPRVTTLSRLKFQSPHSSTWATKYRESLIDFYFLHLYYKCLRLKMRHFFKLIHIKFRWNYYFKIIYPIFIDIPKYCSFAIEDIKLFIFLYFPRCYFYMRNTINSFKIFIFGFIH